MRALLPIPSRAIAATVLCSLVAARGFAAENAPASVFARPVPGGVADLRAIEAAACEIAKAATPCTVGLDIGGAHGSGVVVSQDGYVLTAAHVIGRPGRDARVLFPDGTVKQGRTLGLHSRADVGLVKISEDGTWPYVPIVPRDEGPKTGDWCLAIGHPGGFQADRSAPVRLGRIIDVQDNVLRSDCPITSGDSGGPLFDMRGRVIGIHSRISEELTENLHGPALAGSEAWEQLTAGEIYPSRPPSRFLDQLDMDRDGKITRDELPEGPYRRVFDRFAKNFNLDPNQGHAIEDLVKVLGWRTSPILVLQWNYDREERIGQSLMNSLFTRGRQVRRSFSSVAAPAQRSTVRIECEDQRVALGTIVGADGWIVTKASQLTGETECQLFDGRRFAARRAGVDKEYDLALLQIDATDLDAVAWARSSDVPPGRWLITPGVERSVASVGVVSVGARKIEATAMLGVEIAPSENEAKVARVSRGSGADEAGIVNGDLITHIMGQEVHNIDELRRELHKFRADDVVKATIVRGEETLELDVKLGTPQDVSFFPRFGRGRVDGPLNRVRDGFPKAIQHDTVLDPTLCGGPVLDMSGATVGINIARADRVATYALPSEVVRASVEKLMSGAPAPRTATGRKSM